MNDPLEEDATIAGPISPKLKVASSSTDSDFDVKLIDVYPDNYPNEMEGSAPNKRVLDAPPLHMGGDQQLLGESLFNKSSETAGRSLSRWFRKKMSAQLHDAGLIPYVSSRGHRIMVQVQSSWFPLTDRNPETSSSTSPAHRRCNPESHRAGVSSEGCSFGS